MSPEEIEQACRDAEKLSHMAKQIEPHLKPEDRITILVQDLAAAKAEIAEWRNVIAIICRDGGHYHHEHGTKATAEFCKQQVIKDRTECEDAKAEIERLRYALRLCRDAIVLQQLVDKANGNLEAARSCQPFIDLANDTLPKETKDA